MMAYSDKNIANEATMIATMKRLAPVTLIVLALVLAAGGARRTLADDPAALTLMPLGGKSIAVTAAGIAKLATTTADIAFETSHGPRHAVFEGPLLWTVLEQNGALAGMAPREQGGHVVIVTGRDGYRAALALGEISPEFEGKPVLLAERMDGAALGDGHWRLVVPGDHRGGRAIRDVVTITLR
jgi:hypothetical protein